MKLTESRLLHGNSLEILESLPDKHFDLLLADPPYEISRSSNVKSMGRSGLDFGEWDKEFDQYTWIKKAIPKLKPGASIVIWNDWKKLGKIAECLGRELGLDVNNHAFRTVIWHKTNPNPLNCRSMFVQSVEYAVWTKVPGAKATFHCNYDHGVFWVDHSINRTADHPTKKPDGVFEEIIALMTNPGDWVLDPFAGGGTTCFAAEKLGRNFVAIERDDTHYQTAKAHWEKACV
jgi:site-specific DNA-methyltransferase (adenine-specific)